MSTNLTQPITTAVQPVATAVQPMALLLQPVTPAKQPVWQQRLSDVFWINSVAISNDGSRVVGATFIHDYRQRTGKFLPNVQSRFGTHCLDATAAGKVIWSDEFDGWDGVFGVTISGNGQVAAAGGWLEKTGNTVWGMVRAYSAADGKRLLDFTGLNQRVSWVVLSEDGNVLAAVADDVYVFLRDGKAFNPIPLRLGIGGIANRHVTNVALHPSGSWLAACDQAGHVFMATIEKGAIGRQFRWTAPLEIPFLSIAIARKAETFAVGGGNSVFLFDFAAIRKYREADSIVPLEHDTTDADTPPNKPDGRIQENIRWVAISADGNLVSAVANRLAATKPSGAGLLVALWPEC